MGQKMDSLDVRCYGLSMDIWGRFCPRLVSRCGQVKQGSSTRYLWTLIWSASVVLAAFLREPRRFSAVIVLLAVMVSGCDSFCTSLQGSDFEPCVRDSFFLSPEKTFYLGYYSFRLLPGWTLREVWNVFVNLFFPETMSECLAYMWITMSERCVKYTYYIDTI